MSADGSDLLLRFREEARSLGVELGPRQLSRFRVYLRVLREWNRVIRLVADDQEETIVWGHFMDSLSVCRLLRESESLLDVGSGAGFPGVPLKIASPTIRLSLVEPSGRKVSFLKQLLRELALKDVAVYASRVQEAGLAERFTAIVSRGLAPPRRWLSWVSGLLDEGGRIILMLGPTMEMAGLQTQLQEIGLRMCEGCEFRLPVVGHRRRLIVVCRG